MIQLKGYHYHNARRENQGWEYVRSTLIENLEHSTVDLPTDEVGGTNHTPKAVPIADLGVSWPVIVNWSTIRAITVEKPDAEFENDPTKKNEALKQFDFTVQFCWQETPPSKRREKEEAARAAAANAAEPQQPGLGQPTP